MPPSGARKATMRGSSKGRSSAFQTSTSASTSSATWASLWNGVGVMRNRSVPLAALAPVLRAPGSLFAIQTPVAPAERAVFREMGGIDLIDELHDFSDTAGLLACLDYVVTADTAAVHLAGALARPTCLLLPYNADFRWLIGRPDTPWYPTVQLLRQNLRGDWTELLQRLAKALGAQL